MQDYIIMLNSGRVVINTEDYMPPITTSTWTINMSNRETLVPEQDPIKSLFPRMLEWNNTPYTEMEDIG